MSEMHEQILPGSVIGILGGGQLGRMTALAAAAQGYHCHIYCPEPDNPASQVARYATFADYGDRDALAAFAEAVDLVTFEFENIPAETAFILSEHTRLCPGPRSLEIAQDRISEKRFFESMGGTPAPWRPVDSLDDLHAALSDIGTPAILKTCRLGYDGKGQVRIDDAAQAADAWQALTGTTPPEAKGEAFAVLEGFVPFACELSVIAARNARGDVAVYAPTQNVHTNHILHTSTVPADVPEATRDAARNLIGRAVEALDYRGILALELFMLPGGDLVINEMAPRPHNSGHWTMDACATSQFDQFIRAICNLPLLNAERHSNAVMTNLLGDDVHNLAQWLADPHSHIHIYGKSDARAGRKMGHVNTVHARNRDD